MRDMSRETYHIKPRHYEPEPVRVSFSSAVAIVVAAVGLIYLIVGVVI